MRIAILGLRGIPSSYSGYETFVGELAPALAARGHHVTVYCRRALFSPRPRTYKGVRLKYLTSFEHKILSTLSHSLLAMLHAIFSRTQVILVVNVANGPLGWLAKIGRKRTVINIDGLEWERPKWSPLAKRYFLEGARQAVKAFDVLVADSKEMQRVYKERFGADCHFIPYGAHLGYSSNPSLLAPLGLTPRNYFLVVARRVPDNNGDLIVEGFVKSSIEAPLLVVGGANYRGNVIEREFFNRLKELADSRVHFLGQLHDRATLTELWANCFAVVHGHEHGGTNPSLLEALSHGSFVLALDSPFSREVLKDGKFGILFNRSNLTEILEDAWMNPETADAFRKSARDRIVDSYTWEMVVEEYERLFSMSREVKP